MENNFFDETDLKALMKEQKELVKQLAQYEAKIASYWNTFLRGVLNGFGFFIGSVILVALTLFILSKIQGWAYIGHYVENIINVITNNPNKVR